MGSFRDLTGQRFNRLTVIEMSRKVKSGKRERYYWKCKCDCGNIHEARTDSLTSGNVQSCGCLRDEKSSINVVKNHKHKMSGTKIYHTWQGMINRCTDKNNPRYCRYGERGISVYGEWIKDFTAFYEYVSKLPHFSECGYTLDRIDNNRGYYPDNVRWATAKEQSRNRSSNINIEYDGELMTLKEVSERTGILYGTLVGRYKRGDRGERLLRDTITSRLVEYNGEMIDLKTLSKITGINYSILCARYFQGKRGEELTKACQPRGKQLDCV